jgi:PAS domain-containing protein
MTPEVSELRRLTETVSKHDNEISDFYKQWHHVFNALPNLMFVVDTNYHIKFVNNALESELKINKGDLLNSECNVIGGLDEENDTYYIDNGSGEYKKSGLGFAGIVNKGFFEFDYSPIYDDEKELLGYVCVVNDIVKDKT